MQNEQVVSEPDQVEELVESQQKTQVIEENIGAVEDSLPLAVQQYIKSGKYKYPLYQAEYNQYENLLKQNRYLKPSQDFFHDLNKNIKNVCQWLIIPLENLNNVQDFKRHFREKNIK